MRAVPYDERREYRDTSILNEKEQALAVLMLDNGEELPLLEGFEFCGYDLADDSGISVLTNCGWFVNENFDNVEMNRYGILNKRADAEYLKEILPKLEPDEGHMYCEIYAVWRMI